ncbi:hypothetical protein GTZ78_53220 [Streptomyces sp. SID8361]|nr:hypothetical protein [Streptomyces sp. SID8361]
MGGAALVDEGSASQGHSILRALVSSGGVISTQAGGHAEGATASGAGSGVGAHFGSPRTVGVVVCSVRQQL